MAKGDPQPTDIADKIIAQKRRTAHQTKPKEKSERPVYEKQEKSPRSAAGPSQPLRMSPKRQHAAPQVIIQRPSADADAEDFSRRLNISTHSSPRAAHSPSKSNQHSKLYNPDRDPIPTMRRTAEPEAMSDTPSNGRLARDTDAPTRQLFDPRKDNPVRFSVLGRPNHQSQRQVPTPKSSGEYISASSTSSYAASQVSSTFTLSSTTDGSSASSALFDRGDKPHDESSGTNVFALQLKKLYRAITSMEMKIQKEEPDEEKDGRDNSRILLKGRNGQSEENEMERDKDKWIRRIEEHKTLAETIHNLLGISLAPSVPASLRNIPTKYNIMVRLWTFGFHRLLEDLRRASLTSSLALEHLQSFIYYAYTFYTSLLEEPPLSQFKSSWLEALGDLARYRMMVATMINGSTGPIYAAVKVSLEATPRAESLTNGHLEIPHDSGTKSVSNAAAARIDDSPSPSVGVAAARSMELKPEVEQWRHLARDWYGKGLTEQPGTGRLHGHLGMLSREVRGEELRAVYHFVKSMTTLHPFSVSRESILSIWSPEAQARRQLPETRLPDLFVFLHGMLFTNIQLDDFRPTLFRFIERLELEGAEERTWTMMAVVNIGAILEYNKSNSTLKRCGGVSSRETGSTNPVRLMAKKEGVKDDDKMDVDEKGPVFSPPPSDSESDAIEQSIGFKLALELTFAMLSYVLRHPFRRASPYSKSRLNPYLTVILTFLVTMLKHEKTREVMERSIPWEELAAFFVSIPRTIMHSQGLDRISNTPGGERWMMLTSSCAPPLPEDWCLRGMEWVGRKVFERGYWKSGDDRQAEIEVLDETEVEEMDDGRIETDGDEEDNSETKKRYIRIVRSAVTLAGEVPGFTWVEGTREWRVEGELSAKVQRWKEEDRQEREAEERRKMGTRWADDDSMDVDEDASEGFLESSDDDDESDSPEIRELKERRRHLQSLLKSSQMEFDRSSVRRSSAKERRSQQTLPMQPGYTVLVVDTNILLSALSMFSSLVESFRWTILVPLPVIMELDGLKGNPSPQLSEAAENALSYITSRIRSHSSSLKVQTSKGNYLTSLNVRTEAVDFTHGRKERSMDDLILKTAMWHEEHWTDRSAMLKVDDTKKFADPVKVVLISLDRNLRLKARSRQLPAAGEKDLGVLISDGK